MMPEYSIDFKNNSTDAATPDSSRFKLYNKSGVMYWRDSAGEVYPVVMTYSATVTTTDNTATTLDSYTVSASSCVVIRGDVWGAKDDYSAAAFRSFEVCIRRTSGGSAAIVGSATYGASIQEDSSGTPAIEVDLSTNDFRVRVTGISAETWQWRAEYSVRTL